MTTQPSLEEFYTTTVLPVIDELETYRYALAQRSLYAGAGLALVAIAIALFIARFIGSIEGVFFAPAIAIGAWYYLTSEPRIRYRSAFKERIIKQLVAFVGTNLEYRAHNHISQANFRESWLFDQRIDRYRGEDMVIGQHGATKFRFSEVHAEYKTETRSNGRKKTNWHTIFKGILFVADFNKHFSGFTLVAPDTAERAFGFVGKAIQAFGTNFNSERGDLVTLEDTEFEKAFVVRSTDQIEARYILSPKLMRRILDYRAKTGKTIRLSFRNSNVYVAISSGKNAFEAPFLFRPLRNTLTVEQVQTYLEDLLLAVSIVDELDLNTRIWSKQNGIAQIPN